MVVGRADLGRGRLLPIHGFYASFGSLASGEVVTLRVLGEGVDQLLTSPSSTHDVLGRGYGFVSEQPVERMEIASSEPGEVLLGYFVGLVASDQTISGPGLHPCSNATCDYAVAHALRRPVAFLTPTTGTGDLDTWVEVGFETGIAAGDAVCRHWAQQAGYPVPNRFIAFLGQGTTEPLCRAVGLAGSYSFGSCDDVPVPARMARWWRPDGLPWAAPLEVPTVEGQFPVRPPLDANGQRSDEAYFTAWHPALSCGDWDDSTGSTEFGDPDSVDFGWLNAGATSCALERRLLCVERALGLPFPAESAAGRPVFVSLAKGPGDLRSWPEADPAALTGTEAADSVCAAEAAAAGLEQPSTFRAWLSTASDDAIDRLTEGGPYARTDGLALADSIADLVDGRLDTGIKRHAVSAASSIRVWTGTLADGTHAGSSCGAWDATTGSAQSGSTGQAGAGWTAYSTGACTASLHLYCVSDAVSPLFADGFETSAAPTR